MAIKKGDNIQSTRQHDGSFNVVIDMKSAEFGEKRIVANIKDPDIYYAVVRDLFDNPLQETRQDLEEEKERLISMRSDMDIQIAEVDLKISKRGL